MPQLFHFQMSTFNEHDELSPLSDESIESRRKKPQWVVDAILNTLPAAEAPDAAPVGLVLKQLHFPVFTTALMLSVWVAFLYGKFFMIPDPSLAVQDINPPNTRLFFMTVDPYPACGDARLELWRLVSVQFVHAGWSHIISNTLLGWGIGVTLESVGGTVLAALTFEVAVVVGSLMHSYVLPYNSLVGCSHGVYGWYGALMCYCAAHVYQSRANALVFMLLAALIGYSGVGYVRNYQPDIAYEAHFGGFVAGLLICCVWYSGWNKSAPGFAAVSTVEGGSSVVRLDRSVYTPVSPENVAICGIFCAMLAGFAGYLSVHYATSWPPSPDFNPTLHSLPAGSCCMDLFRIMGESRNLTQSYITSNFYCGAQRTLSPPSR